jgi:hypothetical protein
MSSKRYDSPAPGSIGAQIYRGKSFDEIKAVNPFASRDWLNNTAEFSDTRRKPVDALFENGNEISKTDMCKRKSNEGRYAAFRAIAHGIAKWDEGRQLLVKINAT